MNKEQAQQLIAFSEKFKEASPLYSFSPENFLAPYDYGEEITDFIDFCYKNNFVLPDYEKIEKDLTANRAKPEWYAALSEEKVIQCLGYFIRGDRFSDGLVASAIEDGTIVRLFERIKVLHVL